MKMLPQEERSVGNDGEGDSPVMQRFNVSKPSEEAAFANQAQRTSNRVIGVLEGQLPDYTLFDEQAKRNLREREDQRKAIMDQQEEVMRSWNPTGFYIDIVKKNIHVVFLMTEKMSQQTKEMVKKIFSWAHTIDRQKVGKQTSDLVIRGLTAINPDYGVAAESAAELFKQSVPMVRQQIKDKRIRIRKKDRRMKD